MERNMRLNEDVLRFMTVRVDELEAGPSMMMQRREERSDRGPRRRDFEGGGEGDRAPREAERAPGGEA
jgi:small subunit ribosomal protein S6